MAKHAGHPPVPFWRLYLRMGGWIPLILGLFFAATTWISLAQHNLAERFETEGVEARATVKDKYWTESRDSDGDRTITYYLDVEFDTDDGENMLLTRSVPKSVHDAAGIGGQMTIWYLRSDPDRIEMRRGETRHSSVAAQIAALIAGGLLLGGFWFVARRAVAAVRARRYGARETAIVTGIARTNIRVNRRYRYRLTWREASGREGRSLAYKKAHIDGIPTGSEITVYQGIKRAWWTGDVGERPDNG